MDPRFSAQDVYRCHLCDTPIPALFCDNCSVSLCKECAGEHLLEESKDHKVVPIKLRRSSPSYPNCPSHVTKQCELYCEECDIPICVHCVTSEDHDAHKKIDILEKFQSKKEAIQTRIQELEKSILKQYQKTASEILIQRSQVHNESDKLTKALVKLGEDLHKAVDEIINRRKTEISSIYLELLENLTYHEREVTARVDEINQTLFDLEKLLDSNDISLVTAYTSKNAEFKTPPPEVHCNLPCFFPLLNTEQLYEHFGSLFISFCDIEDTERKVSKKYIIDKPHADTAIVTGYKSLYSVVCLNDQEVWTSGNDNIIKLHNIHGDLLSSVQTKSECAPSDIAVTRNGDLVYTDSSNKTLNIVKNGNIHEVVKLLEWRPLNVCSTSSADLLVTMVSNDNQYAKVVRYSGSIEIQKIQYDDQGQPLYSTEHTKYISENKNRDICVADNGAHAIVVVNHTGRLRFTYTGSFSLTKGTFDPVGITTDSQGRILTADFDNACIHILDKDGEFLCLIDNCGLCYPWGLCVDTDDNLFVADDRSRVKRIQYSE